MPEYDPKSIPILDDIIEDDNTEAEKIVPHITVNDSEQEQGSLGSFTSIAAEIETTDINIDASVTGIAAIDQFIASTDNDAEDHAFETVQTALIDNDTAEFDDIVTDLQQEKAHPEEIQPHVVQLEETQNSTDSDTGYTDTEDMTNESVQPAALNSIVDDVVKQLMPELEQQLRFLVQQALEEKLPADIFEHISRDKND